tara:strand:- start:12518 stop:13069 length:552 start_codon:yes stop_codon:yes gene_type:complete
MTEEITLENFRTGLRFAVRELKPKITANLGLLTKKEFEHMKNNPPKKSRVKGFFSSSMIDTYEQKSLELMQLIVEFDWSSSGRMKNTYIQGRDFSYEYFLAEPFLKRLPKDVARGLHISWGIKKKKDKEEEKNKIPPDPYFHTKLKDSGVYSIKQSLVNVYTSTLFLVDFLRLYQASKRMRLK